MQFDFGARFSPIVKRVADKQVMIGVGLTSTVNFGFSFMLTILLVPSLLITYVGNYLRTFEFLRMREENGSPCWNFFFISKIVICCI